MRPFFLFACVLLVFAVINMAKKPQRRGIYAALAMGWGSAGAASQFETAWLYIPAGIGFILSLVLSVTWNKRQMGEIQKMLGWTPELEAAMEAAIKREDAAAKKAAAQEAARLAESERLARDYAIEAGIDEVSITVTVSESVTFPIETGDGKLRCDAGAVGLVMKIGVDEAKEEESTLAISTVLRDQDGQAWQCDSYLMASVLIEPAIGHDEDDAPNYVSWKNAPEEWRLTFRENSLVVGAVALMDSRDYYELRVDGVLFTIPEKYQGPSMDLAWHAPSRCFLVRIDGLYHAIDDDLDPHSDSDVPAFILVLEPERLAILAKPTEHWKSPGDWMDYETEDTDRPLPLFRKVEMAGKLEPSQGVSLLREERSD